MDQKKTKTVKSPFKEKSSLEKEITAFINKHKSTISNQATRMSDYFEMYCFNYVVRFYENSGYNVSIENLINKKYRYKCSTSGVQSNFSYFLISKSKEDESLEFEIQHNLAIQSSHCDDIFTTPDICVIRKNSILETTDYYERTKRRFCYVENQSMMSFFEVKHFAPFPELLFSFIGTVNELRKEIMTNELEEVTPVQLAPSIMLSGKPNKQTKRIKEVLEGRYRINIFFDLFDSGVSTFSKKNTSKLYTVGKVPESDSLDEELDLL